MISQPVRGRKRRKEEGGGKRTDSRALVKSEGPRTKRGQHERVRLWTDQVSKTTHTVVRSPLRDYPHPNRDPGRSSSVQPTPLMHPLSVPLVLTLNQTNHKRRPRHMSRHQPQRPPLFLGRETPVPAIVHVVRVADGEGRFGRFPIQLLLLRGGRRGRGGWVGSGVGECLREEDAGFFLEGSGLEV